MSSIIDRNALLRVLLMSLGAFVLYGGWAFAVNLNHNVDRAIVAMLVQGSATFFSTLTLTGGMEVVFKKFPNNSALRFWFTALGPQIAVSLITIFFHFLVGTPDIVATVAPSMIIGSVYGFIYTYRLTSWATSA